jgi:predicted DNA-binding transcriptional regulator AlpA
MKPSRVRRTKFSRLMSQLGQRRTKWSPCTAEQRVQQSAVSEVNGRNQLSRWVTGSALRKIFNVSAVTLWRWRHNNSFPIAKRINGRLYFPWHEVEAWLEAQPDAG